MNPYTILEVSPQASDEEIKKQFRKLAQQNHPDRGGNEEKFKQINLAYSILSDPVRRKHFDSTGEYNINQDIRQQVLNNLSMLITHFMNNLDPEMENLIVCMKNDIAREKVAIGVNITNTITAISKLEKFLRKIKRKKEGENVLKMFVASQIKNHESSILSFNRNLEVCDEMIKLLEDYEYGDEEFQMLINSISNQEVHSQ